MSRETCVLAEKRQHRFIFEAIKVTFTINPTLKFFFCASEKEFYPRRGPSRGQLDWDAGIWGHATMAGGGPCARTDNIQAGFHVERLYKLEGIEILQIYNALL